MRPAEPKLHVACGLRGSRFCVTPKAGWASTLAPGPGSAPPALLRPRLLHEACWSARWALPTRPRAERSPGWAGDGEPWGRAHGQRAVCGVPGLGALQQRRPTRGAVQRAQAPLLCDDLRGQELPHVWREWFPPPASQEPEPARCCPTFASHLPRVSLFAALSYVIPPCGAAVLVASLPLLGHLATWGEFRRDLLAQGRTTGEHLSGLAEYLFTYIRLWM